MCAGESSAPLTAEQIEQLRSAVADVSREVRQLSTRVGELADVLKGVGPDRSTPADDPPPKAKRQNANSAGHEEIALIVRPLPELAMAAVAETALRGMPGVKQVVSIVRADDQARFELEVSTDADLIAEMRTALPVAFEVTESGSDEISVDLKWAWGAET
jgi:hypothetical protein